MSAAMLATKQAAPLDALRALLGPANVVSDEAELAFYSSDVYQRAAIDAALVIRPQTVDQLAQAVKLCTENGAPVIARGGGLSYTGGFLPTRPGSVIVDMLNLDRVIEVNETDMFVTVECGATWKTLNEVLKPLGLRTPYFGPMSGYGSTVGGALSQGSVFLGSTAYGVSGESVLALDVVLADGQVLSTGSSGNICKPHPFFRYFGPDLAGLFLHDCGALGLKARATLRLIQAPKVSGYLTFTFSNHADLFNAMSEISRRGLSAECFGADPYIWSMRLWDDDLTRDVKRVIGVMQSGVSLIGGLKDAARMAVSGRRALKDVEYAMNVTVDGRSQLEVDFAIAEIRSVAKDAGREVEATVPKMVRGAPFLPPNDLLGPKGQRWAPIHGIAPHSRAISVANAMIAFFEERADLLERNGIEWGYVTFAISTTAILIEPMLYWPGARELYHERMIEPSYLAKLPVLAPDAEAAAVMKQLRKELAIFWAEQGCAHLQIGKTYRYLENRQPAARSLVEALKDAVDPHRLINPGALGLS